MVHHAVKEKEEEEEEEEEEDPSFTALLLSGSFFTCFQSTVCQTMNLEGRREYLHRSRLHRASSGPRVDVELRHIERCRSGRTV